MGLPVAASQSRGVMLPVSTALPSGLSHGPTGSGAPVEADGRRRWRPRAAPCCHGCR